MLVSKRVATRLCGEEAVRLYADSQITSAVNDDDEKSRWKFFQELSLSTTYHFAAEVNALVQRHRATLEEYIAFYPQDDPVYSSLEFGRPDWWKVV
jgi:hypothetical protein